MQPIIDLHCTQFGDAHPKMRGLASYAEAKRGIYLRREAIAEVDAIAALDLMEAVTRAAIAAATSAAELY